MPKNMLYAVIASLSASGIATSIHAEDVIKVVGKKEQEPGNLILESEELLKSQPTDLEDILANQPSVAVGGSTVVGQKMYVRGLEDVLVNVSIDGAQTPANMYHHASRIQLEPEFIKTIELDAGAGPATNGPGALTGAMRVTLKDAFDMLESYGEEESKTFGGFVKATAIGNGDNGNKMTGSLYGQASENIGWIAGLTSSNRGDYADGDGDTPGPSSYEHLNGFIKLNGELENQKFSLTHESIHNEGESYERPHMVGFSPRFMLSDYEVDRNSTSANYEYNGSDLFNVKATLYNNVSSTKIQQQDADVVYFDGETQSFGYSLNNTFNIGLHRLTIGHDARTDRLDGEVNTGRVNGSAEYQVNVYGLFLQESWLATDSLELTGGVRYDVYEFESTKGVSDGVSFDNDGISPNFGIHFSPIEPLTLRTTYARSIRGAAVRDVVFAAGYSFPDDGLDPEIADNFELGLAYELPTGFFFRASRYTQHLRDFVNLNAPTYDSWVNYGDARVEGYEFEIGHKIHYTSLSLSVWNSDTYFDIDGEDERELSDSDLSLGTSIGRTWVFSVNQELPSYNLDLGYSVRHVEREENRVSEDAPDKKAYTVTDVIANWSINSQIETSFSIDNLFNQTYYDHATYMYARGSYSGFTAPGRETKLSVSYKF